MLEVYLFLSRDGIDAIAVLPFLDVEGVTFAGCASVHVSHGIYMSPSYCVAGRVSCADSSPGG